MYLSVDDDYDGDYDDDDDDNNNNNNKFNTKAQNLCVLTEAVYLFARVTDLKRKQETVRECAIASFDVTSRTGY